MKNFDMVYQVRCNFDIPDVIAYQKVVVPIEDVVPVDPDEPDFEEELVVSDMIIWRFDDWVKDKNSHPDELCALDWDWYGSCISFDLWDFENTRQLEQSLEIVNNVLKGIVHDVCVEYNLGPITVEFDVPIKESADVAVEEAR